jgi:hypothetical protein
LMPIEPSACMTLDVATMTPSGQSLTQSLPLPSKAGGTGGIASDAEPGGLLPFGSVTAHRVALEAAAEVDPQ